MPSKLLLITGANGFLARAVARQAFADWQLVALIRPGTSPSSRFHATYESVENLIADLERVDVVMHLAACIPSSPDAAPPELFPVNRDIVEKLVQAYPDSRHVLASSVSVYGAPISLPLTIYSPPNQPNPYGLSKLAAEKLVCQMPQHAIIRFSSLIGGGMKVGSFIPTIVSAACSGKIHLLGDGERLQNYLDIDDAALMCLRAAITKKSFVALGIGERSYSNNQVASILAELTGASIVREGDDHSPSFVYDFRESIDLKKRHVSLKETLERMVQQA